MNRAVVVAVVVVRTWMVSVLVVAMVEQNVSIRWDYANAPRIVKRC
jgi:hypothetical protein